MLVSEKHTVILTRKITCPSSFCQDGEIDPAAGTSRLQFPARYGGKAHKHIDYPDVAPSGLDDIDLAQVLMT